MDREKYWHNEALKSQQAQAQTQTQQVDGELLWRRRANEAADRCVLAETRLDTTKQALAKIVQMGYADDPWVSLAQQTLDKIS